MLLIFNIINTLVNHFLVLSGELKSNISKIDGYKVILYFKNINISLLIEIKNKEFLLRFPKKKEKIHLLIKLTTRDFIKLIFEKKENFRFDIIGEANVAETFFNFFNFVKANWYEIVLKKVNNNYLKIFIRILEISKKRILFNKYYLKKIIYKNLLNENVIISKYQIVTFTKINNDICKKIGTYSNKLKKMEDKC